MRPTVVHVRVQVQGIEPRVLDAAKGVRVGEVFGHGVGYFKLQFGDAPSAEDTPQVNAATRDGQHCIVLCEPLPCCARLCYAMLCCGLLGLHHVVLCCAVLSLPCDSDKLYSTLRPVMI